jgi:hypothetical protein
VPTKTEKTTTCAKCHRVWVPDFSLDCYTIDDVELCEPCAMPYLLKSGNPEPIDQERITNVCKLGQGNAACAFLAMSMSPGFGCAKRSSLEDTIRQRIQEGSMGAKGDNCSGPPAFVIVKTQ